MITIDGSFLFGIAAILSSLGSLWRIPSTARACRACHCIACSRQTKPLRRYLDSDRRGKRHA